MFEQSFYKTEYQTEPVATPVVKGDLFNNYEIKNWELSSRIYKILAVAGAFNLLALLIFSQTSVLTMKGCDSPLVGQVCQALDTIYVASALFGTDRDYIDAVYEKTDLGDAEIMFVDVTGVTPPLSYPEGYFQLANPIEHQAMLDTANTDPFALDNQGFPPGFSVTTPSTGSSVIDTPPQYARPNPNIIDGDLPTYKPPVASSPPVQRKRSRGGRVVKTPPLDSVDGTPDDEKIAQVKPSPTATPAPKVDPTAAPNAYDINKRPFVDLANNVNDLLDKKQVKLESPFVVNAQGKLTKEGKLDPKSFRWGEVTSADQKMIDVVKEAVEAINDSGYLQYLKEISGKDFNLMLKQDETSISAVVQSELESDLRARTMKGSLDLVIAFAKSRKSGAEADQNDKDDLVLLENAKVETEGKKVVIKFNVPKEIALQMIQRKLAEQKALPKQPNGNTLTGAIDNTANK